MLFSAAEMLFSYISFLATFWKHFHVVKEYICYSGRHMYWFTSYDFNGSCTQVTVAIALEWFQKMLFDSPYRFL